MMTSSFNMTPDRLKIVLFRYFWPASVSLAIVLSFAGTASAQEVTAPYSHVRIRNWVMDFEKVVYSPEAGTMQVYAAFRNSFGTGAPPVVTGTNTFRAEVVRGSEIDRPIGPLVVVGAADEVLGSGAVVDLGRSVRVRWTFPYVPEQGPARSIRFFERSTPVPLPGQKEYGPQLSLFR